jgi:hypothetical protein
MVGLVEKTPRGVTIYLSGSIRKGAEDTRSEDFFWTEDDQAFIASKISHSIKFLNPASTDIDRNDFYANFGCDLFLVSKSDIVLVDLRKKKGIGIGAELMLADKLGIPVIGFLGQGSDYKKERLTNVSGQDLSNWTHPFAFGLCDQIFDRLEDACSVIERTCSSSNFGALYREKSERAVRYFLKEHPKLGADFNEIG